jgi:hypothetical protein
MGGGARPFCREKASPELLCASIFRDFTFVVYTKPGCFANRFLQKNKADFREEKEKLKRNSEEKRRSFGNIAPLCLTFEPIFERALKMSKEKHANTVV